MEVLLMSDIDILYQISKIKNIEYKNTLFITSLIDLLIAKGLITTEELTECIKSADSIAAAACQQKS
jgi:hypothetical protein